MWSFYDANYPKCEHFSLLVCPLRFPVISAMRRLGNVQSFKTYMFHFWAFCHERDSAWAGCTTLRRLHGRLSPRLTGLPYLADRATCQGWSPHLSCKLDQDKIRNYMDRWVTSPTWGPPPPCERALYVNQGKRSVTRRFLIGERQNTKKLYPTDCLFKVASHWFHRNAVRFITNKSIFHRISPLYVCAF